MNTVDLIHEQELSKDHVKAMTAAVAGVAGFIVGKQVEKKTGIDDLGTLGLVIGSGLGPLLIKEYKKAEDMRTNKGMGELATLTAYGISAAISLVGGIIAKNKAAKETRAEKHRIEREVIEPLRKELPKINDLNNQLIDKLASYPNGRTVGRQFQVNFNKLPFYLYRHSQYGLVDNASEIAAIWRGNPPAVTRLNGINRSVSAQQAALTEYQQEADRLARHAESLSVNLERTAKALEYIEQEVIPQQAQKFQVAQAQAKTAGANTWIMVATGLMAAGYLLNEKYQFIKI